jgi:hypothetical protein
MSTLAMAADVFFPESRGRRAFGFKRVSAIHTEKSWKEFAGIAELTLPRNVSDFKRVEADDLFQLGDPITIKFGYGTGELPTEFVGYISDVVDGVPYVLKCEDEMFKLKRGTVTVSKKGINLTRTSRKQQGKKNVFLRHGINNKKLSERYSIHPVLL